METKKNPLLEKLKLPGRVFNLPSRGALYREGEVARDEGEVHVRALSALAEINLKNPDMLFSGEALAEVFAECVPDVKNVTELYGRDIDAIMFFLRLVTYGPQYEISVKHNCENAKDHSYLVDIEQMVMGMKQLDPTTIDADRTVTLDNGQVVVVHPVKFDHMIKLFQLNMGKTEFTNEDIRKNIVYNLTNLIESVDGITDKEQIAGWVAAISTKQQGRINDALEKINDWGPPSTCTLKCKDCGKELIAELPLNPVSFFTE